jgi:hypothetical protein
MKIYANFGAIWRDLKENRMNTEQEMIQNILNHQPNGCTLETIIKGLSHTVPKRSVQRLLSGLVTQGVIEREGKGRATRYFYTLPAVQEPPKDDSLKFSIPLSNAAKNAQAYIYQPIQQRRPQGYQLAFLHDYQPNHSTYLSTTVKNDLHRLGKQPGNIAVGGTFTKQILNRVLIDLSWNSSRLEGNTYSLLETQRLLEYGERSDKQSTQDAQMLLNHKAAIEFLVDNEDDIRINPSTILNLHSLLADNLLSDPEAVGRLRKRSVGVSGTVYHPLEIPQLIEEYFVLILEKANAIQDPIEQAFFMMVHIPYLQAFEDVNKRVSRLAANIPLIKNNYCPLSFIGLPKHAYVDGILAIYELNDVSILADVFHWTYRHSIERYSGIKEAMEGVDPIKFRYRKELATLIHDVICNNVEAKQISRFIAQWSREHIKQEDQKRFIEIVETEMMYLAPGNIIRYKIPLAAFEEWKKMWK